MTCSWKTKHFNSSSQALGTTHVEMKICSLYKPTLGASQPAIETAVTAETSKGLHGPYRARSWQAGHKQACGRRTKPRWRQLITSGMVREAQANEAVNETGQTSSQQHGQQSCGNCGYAEHQSADISVQRSARHLSKSETLLQGLPVREGQAGEKCHHPNKVPPNIFVGRRSKGLSSSIPSS